MTKPDQTNLINKCRVGLGDLSVNLVSLYYPPPFLMLGSWLFLDHERFNEINVFYKIKIYFHWRIMLHVHVTKIMIIVEKIHLFSIFLKFSNPSIQYTMFK